MRGEFVLGGGNLSSGIDANEVTTYPVGTQADRNYRTPVYNFSDSYLPGGIIQYSGSGSINGKLLMTSAASNSVIILTKAGDGTISSVQANISGLENFVNPVDITENPATGFMYVAENGGQQIVLIRAITPGAISTTSKSVLVFNDPTTSGASPGNTITITNNGTSALTIPSNAFTLTGTERGAIQHFIQTIFADVGGARSIGERDGHLHFQCHCGSSPPICRSPATIRIIP